MEEVEEQQVVISQQPAPRPSKKLPRKKLILGLVAFIIVFGGIGSVLAWRTTYLDNYLPASVKEFFGRGEEAGEEEEEPVPPVISSVKAANITETGTTVTWTTDVEATSQVEYGTTASYGSQTTEDTTLVASHTVSLSGLIRGTLYHYRVISKSAEGGSAISEDYTFTTEDPTKNWKTYKNTTLGFLIKHPPNYVPGTPESGMVYFEDKETGDKAKLMVAKNFSGGWACTTVISTEEIAVDGEKVKLDIHSTMLYEGDECTKVDPNGDHMGVVVLHLDPNKDTTKNWFFKFGIDRSKEAEEILLFKTILSTFKRL